MGVRKNKFAVASTTTVPSVLGYSKSRLLYSAHKTLTEVSMPSHEDNRPFFSTALIERLSKREYSRGKHTLSRPSTKSIISIIVLSIFLISGILASPRAYAFASGQPAAIVIGFSNFTTNNASIPPTQTSLYSPGSIAFDPSGNLWVADASDSRVLEFKSPFSSGEAASIVLGFSDFGVSAPSSPNSTDLFAPDGIAFDSSGNLWVADSTFNRVVEFKAPFSDGENESIVIGQPTFTAESGVDAIANATLLNAPTGLAFDPSGNLWVSDDVWNRVLEFKAPLTTFEAASTVIGQTNFTSGVQDIPGCPQNCAALTSPNSLSDPGRSPLIHPETFGSLIRTEGGF